MEKIMTETSQLILKRQTYVCFQNTKEASAREIIKWLFSGSMVVVKKSSHKQLLKKTVKEKWKKV